MYFNRVRTAYTVLWQTGNPYTTTTNYLAPVPS